MRLILILLASLSSLQAGLLINPYRFAAAAAGGSEGFEGTGAPSLWTDASTGNTVNWDYTTAPIVGAQSLFLTDPSSGDRYAYYDYAAAVDEIWVAFRFKISVDPVATISIAGFEDAAGNDMASVNIENDGSLRGKVQATLGTLILDITPGTVYRLKARYVKGTGSNETLQIWCNSDSAGSWTLTQTQSNGTSTAQAGRFYFYITAATNANLTIDNVLVKTSDITWAEVD